MSSALGNLILEALDKRTAPVTPRELSKEFEGVASYSGVRNALSELYRVGDVSRKTKERGYAYYISTMQRESRNAEHYADPTAAKALNDVVKEEKAMVTPITKSGDKPVEGEIWYFERAGFDVDERYLVLAVNEDVALCMRANFKEANQPLDENEFFVDRASVRSGLRGFSFPMWNINMKPLKYAVNRCDKIKRNCLNDILRKLSETVLQVPPVEKPVEVVKEVEKIVEKPIEVVKEVVLNDDHVERLKFERDFYKEQYETILNKVFS